MRKHLIDFPCGRIQYRAMVLVGALAFAGCAAEDAGLYEVTGDVTFKGQPLDHGTIQFEPTDPQRCNGGGAVIEKGKYAIAKKRGLKPGVYVVRISSGDASQPQPTEAPGVSGPPAKERIPEEWNVNSTQKVEVTTTKNAFEHRIP